MPYPAIFGEFATLDGGERTASATAINHVEVMALPEKAILDLIESNPKLAVAAIRFLCTRLRETDLLLEAIALHQIEVRLSRLLLSALKSQSTTCPGQVPPLHLGISQGEVALLIGASRPKVTNAISALEDIGAITRKDRKLREADVQHGHPAVNRRNGMSEPRARFPPGRRR